MTNRTKIGLAMTGLGAGIFVRNMLRSSQERSLAGDVVLITGGSRGLGLMLASQFATEGCHVAICARDAAELDQAKDKLHARGADVFTVACDVTSRSEVDQMIQAVTTRFGRVDILVNNAGTIQVGPLESMTIDDFEDAMNTMFWGTVYPTLTLLPVFLARHQGHIVNITSIGGKVSVPHLLPYSSAKTAATGFSHGLRSELSGTGVKVTTIAPGLMRTGSYNAALFKGDQAAEANWFSVAASLPGLSMDVRRAARQIVSAVKRGDSEKVLSTPAELLAKVHAFAPGLTQDLLGAVAKLVLPQAAGSKQNRPGWSLENLRSPKMRAVLVLGRMAARQLNQKTA